MMSLLNYVGVNNTMNKELDELLCLLDGKITAYRMNNPYVAYTKLVSIQQDIQKLWDINRGE